jgi:hypothetical protein
MTEKTITDIFNFKYQYLRSANIERDFSNPRALSGYVVTDFTRSCIDRLAWSLEPNSGQRAWRITGDYGSGKSSFALFLAHLFSDSNLKQLRPMQQLLKPSRFGIKRPHFTPILITCDRQPLSITILRGLKESHTCTRDRKSTWRED